MRTIDLMYLLLMLPSPVLAAAPDASIGDVSSVVEVIGSIVNAAKALDGILLFLILIATIGIIAVVLHVLHKRNAVTFTLFALLILAVAVAARTHDAREELQSAEQSRLFLPLEQSERLGPFTITLTDVDTLKTKIKEGEATPWAFNLKFGKDALKDFVELGQTRLKTEFIADPEALKRWPTFDELIAMTIDDKSSDNKWQSMMKRLEFEVANPKTERRVELKQAFSKWPVVHLTIRDARTNATIVERYFPDRSVIALPDEKGTTHRLKIETVFNGDRDLGEAEACVLWLEKVSK